MRAMQHFLKFLIFFFLILSKASLALAPGTYRANAMVEYPAHNLKEIENKDSYSWNSFVFTENKGQVIGYDGMPHPEVKFSIQHGGIQVFLLETGLAYQFTKVSYPEGYREIMRDEHNQQNSENLLELQARIHKETFRMDMTLVGANKHAVITSTGRSTSYTHFYNRGILDVHTYSKITYHEIYPGIDWVLYTNDVEIKYDFVIHPGADPGLIQVQFKHADEIELDQGGRVILKSKLGNVIEKAPMSFQSGKELETKFVLNKNIVTYNIREYNSNDTLVIDPALIWSTYYGGNGLEEGTFCASDNMGNVFLAGVTESSSNIASGGYQNNYGGGTWDSFLVKFNSSGIRQWGTYYGGVLNDLGVSCATDFNGNVYLAGATDSQANISSNGFQNLYGGGAYDAFLVKFNSSGIRLWATYYGGIGYDYSLACSTDLFGNLYLGGQSSSASGIASGGHQNTFGGGSFDAFLVKFDSLGVRQWGTYYGGSGSDYGCSCSNDGLGNIFLSGYTGSNANIASLGHQNSFAGGIADAFLVKMNSNGVRQWGTYYGGTSNDYAYSCASDPFGNVFLAGSSLSSNGIASGGHQNVFGGGSDAILVKFNTNGVRQWGTYYGSSAVNDHAQSCVTDVLGNIYLAGWTESTSGIASGGIQNTLSGGSDMYLVKFDNLGIRQWGTYFGGTNYEYYGRCALDSWGNVYVAGQTSSTNGVHFAGHQANFGGGTYDAYLVKFCDNPMQPTAILGNTTLCSGSTVTYSISSIAGATSYSWTYTGLSSGSSVSNTIQIVPMSSGVLSAVAQNACGSSSAQTLQINVNPEPTIGVNSGSICAGNSFTINPSGASTYTIQGGNPVVMPTTNSNYTVMGTSAQGCVSSLAALASVTVHQLPNLTISGTLSVICSGESLNLTASGANTYTWSTGATGPGLSLTPNVTSSYTLIGSDINGCKNTASVTQNVDGCVFIDETLVGWNDCLIYPNPNSGEFFIESTQELKLSIYNVLNQLVLQQNLSPGKNLIHLKQQGNGLYLIQIQQAKGQSKIFKLLKD